MPARVSAPGNYVSYLGTRPAPGLGSRYRVIFRPSLLRETSFVISDQDTKMRPFVARDTV